MENVELPVIGDDGELTRFLRRLQAELAEVDGAAPVVPRGIARKVEQRPLEVAQTARELAPPH